MKNKQENRLGYVLISILLLALMFLYQWKARPFLLNNTHINPLIIKSFADIFQMPMLMLITYPFAKMHSRTWIIIPATILFMAVETINFFDGFDIQTIYNMAMLFLGGFIIYIVLLFRTREK